MEEKTRKAAVAPESGVRNRTPMDPVRAATRAIKRHIWVLAGMASAGGAALGFATVSRPGAWRLSWQVDAVLTSAFVYRQAGSGKPQ